VYILIVFATWHWGLIFFKLTAIYKATLSASTVISADHNTN
jgi:hypothetical protein